VAFFSKTNGPHSTDFTYKGINGPTRLGCGRSPR
jgi:hypothetical protein